ncbi:hypothetical protein [Pseudomonas koreensis]|uniref:hypothetical protein n=1 Tax=Pseudomonas koreensis TaxID=198620 RepID=UPI003F8299D5
MDNESKEFKICAGENFLGLFFGLKNSGEVKQLDGNDLDVIAKRIVVAFKPVLYNSVKDGPGKFPSAVFFQLDEGEYKNVLNFKEISKLSDEEYDNTFKAIKVRSVEDALFSAATGLYASVRGYLGW